MDNDFFIPNYIEITGGNPTDGTINISGAKNEILGAMAACVLTDEVLTLTNVPYISDVLDMGRVLMNLGVDVQYSPKRGILRLHADKITSNSLSKEAGKFRASYYLWGPLLARFMHTGEFKSLHVEIPGGCGKKEAGEGKDKQEKSSKDARGIDYHVNLLKLVLSADIRDYGGQIDFLLPEKKIPAGGHGVTYTTLQVSHGATFHWMLTASVLNQLSKMYNASCEPEIPALLQKLNGMGANLRGMGFTALHSRGHDGLLHGGTFRVMPDRLEAGSYACLAFATGGKLRLNNADANTCRPWLNFLKEMSGNKNITIDGGSIHFDFSARPKFAGRVLQCSPYPGKETDMQQILVPPLSLATGESYISDPVSTWRDQQLPQMRQFGIDCESEKIEKEDMPYSITNGLLEILVRPSQIRRADTTGSDLRGTFGIIECGAMADGLSRVDRPNNAFRGYPNLLMNLQKLGIRVTASGDGEFLPALPMLKKQTVR
ncbi:MAG: hypothetical protein FWC61_00250 [Proteobacteria bacterium]|nr:hypothetical protein [Pseudomonadota bacterium]